jgi:hypothetical protein
MLLKRARQQAERRGVTLTSLIEQGLHLAAPSAEAGGAFRHKAPPNAGPEAAFGREWTSTIAPVSSTV